MSGTWRLGAELKRHRGPFYVSGQVGGDRRCGRSGRKQAGADRATCPSGGSFLRSLGALLPEEL